MEFERLLLTKNSEFYRFSQNYGDVAYVLILDSFSKAPSNFGEQFFEEGFEPRENFLIVKIALLREIDGKEKNELTSFVESLLSFKPSIDYVIDFFEISEELEFDYPKENGFIELVEKINSTFNLNHEIKVNNIDSFNNIVQN